MSKFLVNIWYIYGTITTIQLMYEISHLFFSYSVFILNPIFFEWILIALWFVMGYFLFKQKLLKIRLFQSILLVMVLVYQLFVTLSFQMNISRCLYHPIYLKYISPMSSRGALYGAKTNPIFLSNIGLADYSENDKKINPGDLLPEDLKKVKECANT